MKTILLVFGWVMVLPCATVVMADVPVEPVKNRFADDAWKLPAENATLKEAPGLKLIQSNCLLCHSVDYISTQPTLTRAQWTAGVDKMRTRFGAVIGTNTVPAIVDYLTANYGKEAPKP